MTDNGPDITRTSVPAAAPPARRAHTYSRLTTALAVLALATAGYALWRLDATQDRLDGVNDTARAFAAQRDLMRAQIEALTQREQRANQEFSRRLNALDDMPRRVQDLVSSVEDLRGHAEGPQRAWSRAEAMFLLELAQRRLTLDRDIDTAIVALGSADSRLAALRDPSFAPVRQEIARELQSLRAVDWPDITGLLARLAGAEERATSLPLLGLVAGDPDQGLRTPSQGSFARAWSIVRGTLSNLIVVRHVEEREAMVVTAEQALLRRQHLQLLLLSARTAIARYDEAGYRSALEQARRWLDEFFDLESPAAQSMLQEIQSLELVDIDPPLPDISGSSRALNRLAPVAPEQP